MKSPRLAKIWRQNSLCVLFLTAWIGATSATVTDLATFTERCAKLATAAEEKSQRAVTGEEGWLFLQAELAHLGHGPLSREVCQPAVDSIVAYHKALEALGVQLMVLPIPAKAEVFPDKLLPDCPADLLANRMADFLTMLKEQGVTIVPFREALQKDRADTYCRTDSHW